MDESECAGPSQGAISKKRKSLIKKFKLKTGGGSSSSAESEGKSGRPSKRTPISKQSAERDISQSSNLAEAWKSAENLNVEENKEASVIGTNGALEFQQGSGLVERTKSVENIQKTMPAFGDLIFDHKTSNNHNDSNNRPSKDHLYKILVIGDLGAGKTSIIKRYVHDFFSQHYRATIGVDFALKVLHWDANTVIRLQLWDIAGQERYGNMTRVYYKEAVGAFIVFDVTRGNTFESVLNWKDDLDSKVQLPDGSAIPCVLLANKCDQQQKEGIVNNSNKMDEFCREKNFAAWFQTSAKENINIEEAATALITQILQNDVCNSGELNKDKDQFSLSPKEETQNKKCYKC